MTDEGALYCNDLIIQPVGLTASPFTGKPGKGMVLSLPQGGFAARHGRSPKGQMTCYTGKVPPKGADEAALRSKERMIAPFYPTVTSRTLPPWPGALS